VTCPNYGNNIQNKLERRAVRATPFNSSSTVPSSARCHFLSQYYKVDQTSKLNSIAAIWGEGGQVGGGCWRHILPSAATTAYRAWVKQTSHCVGFVVQRTQEQKDPLFVSLRVFRFGTVIVNTGTLRTDFQNIFVCFM